MAPSNRCPTCGQPRVKDTLGEAVASARLHLEHARRTTHPDELRAHARALGRATQRIRNELGALEQAMRILLAQTPAPAIPPPPEARPIALRRDPPPPEFHALAHGHSPQPATAAVTPYRIPGRPLWPAAPPPEWHALRRTLSRSDEPSG